MKVVDLTLAYAQDPCTALDLLSTLEDDEYIELYPAIFPSTPSLFRLLLTCTSTRFPFLIHVLQCMYTRNNNMSNEYDTIITLDFTTEVQYTYLDCTVIKKQEVKEVTDMILESIWNTTLQLSKLILDLIIEIQYDVHGLRTIVQTCKGHVDDHLEMVLHIMKKCLFRLETGCEPYWEWVMISCPTILTCESSMDFCKDCLDIAISCHEMKWIQPIRTLLSTLPMDITRQLDMELIITIPMDALILVMNSVEEDLKNTCRIYSSDLFLLLDCLRIVQQNEIKDEFGVDKKRTMLENNVIKLLYQVSCFLEENDTTASSSAGRDLEAVSFRRILSEGIRPTRFNRSLVLSRCTCVINILCTWIAKGRQLGPRAQDFGRIGLQCIFELEMSTRSEILFRGFCGLQEKYNPVYATMMKALVDQFPRHVAEYAETLQMWLSPTMESTSDFEKYMSPFLALVHVSPGFYDFIMITSRKFLGCANEAQCLSIRTLCNILSHPSCSSGKESEIIRILEDILRLLTQCTTRSMLYRNLVQALDTRRTVSKPLARENVLFLHTVLVPMIMQYFTLTVHDDDEYEDEEYEKSLTAMGHGKTSFRSENASLQLVPPPNFTQGHLEPLHDLLYVLFSIEVELKIDKESTHARLMASITTWITSPAFAIKSVFLKETSSEDELSGIFHSAQMCCMHALDQYMSFETGNEIKLVSLLQQYEMIRCLGPSVSRTMCLSPNTLFQILSKVLKQNRPLSESLVLIGFIVTLIKESISSQQEYSKEEKNDSSFVSIVHCTLQLVLTKNLYTFLVTPSFGKPNEVSWRWYRSISSHKQLKKKIDDSSLVAVQSVDDLIKKLASLRVDILQLLIQQIRLVSPACLVQELKKENWKEKIPFDLSSETITSFPMSSFACILLNGILHDLSYQHHNKVLKVGLPVVWEILQRCPLVDASNSSIVQNSTSTSTSLPHETCLQRLTRKCFTIVLNATTSCSLSTQVVRSLCRLSFLRSMNGTNDQECLTQTLNILSNVFPRNRRRLRRDGNNEEDISDVELPLSSPPSSLTSGSASSTIVLNECILFCSELVKSSCTPSLASSLCLFMTQLLTGIQSTWNTAVVGENTSLLSRALKLACRYHRVLVSSIKTYLEQNDREETRTVVESLLDECMHFWKTVARFERFLKIHGQGIVEHEMATLHFRIGLFQAEIARVLTKSLSLTDTTPFHDLVQRLPLIHEIQKGTKSKQSSELSRMVIRREAQRARENEPIFIKRRKKGKRLRSRVQYIDEGLLQEDGTDAFLDLEDFIEE